MQRRRNLLSWAVAVLLVAVVGIPVQGDTMQDFAATFNDPNNVQPGNVTVVLLDHLGNVVVPIISEPVTGMFAYSGRPSFDARTGGAFANQDFRNVVATYADGGSTIVDMYPNAVEAEVHNQTWTPQVITPGDWVRVAADNVGSQTNNVSFDQRYSGPWDSLTLNYDIRIGADNPGNPTANDRADGFGFKLINSDLHGTTGAFYTAGEEPNLSGSLGIGFDIWDNGAMDAGSSGVCPCNTTVSLHWDGQLLKSVNLQDPDNEPTLGGTTFSLETGEPINVTLVVNPGELFIPYELSGGSMFTVNTYAGNAATVIQDGPNSGFLRIAQELGGQGNIVAFNDMTSSANGINASFDFRALNEDATRADGMSFLLVPADTYADADAIDPFGAPGGVEEPNLAGAFGVAFDTFNNDASVQDDPEGMANVGNHVSTHWNGSKLTQEDYSLADFDILTNDPNVWHHADISITGDHATVVITDGADGSVHEAFDGDIPGLSDIGDVRAVFAARTGGAFDHYDVDNVNIVAIPEPGTLGMLSLGSLLLAALRRRSTSQLDPLAQGTRTPGSNSTGFG